MKPDESPTAFASFAASRAVSLSDCTPRQGVDLMFCFYQTVFPIGSQEPDGDMLLFQWGTYDWGAGRHFELNITRQFIEQDLQDDDVISQLSLTFRFEPSAERDALGEGNRWCGGPTEFEIVREFTLSSASFLAVADKKAVAVELVHWYV
ncbi:MAG: hypothetical protein HY080_07700 [Gammaproteobacteria bacterium]|nr:hypothetical protein [Gammaproteobacteria bacterium]